MLPFSQQKIVTSTLVCLLLILSSARGLADGGGSRGNRTVVGACNSPLPFLAPIIRKAPEGNPCLNRGTSIVTFAQSELLFLCREGIVDATYSVSVGSSGFGKTTEGDRKTPLGTYRLSSPRSSEQWGKFIPVAYPNDEQQRTGFIDADGQRQSFTGGDIGIHGPPRPGAKGWFIDLAIRMGGLSRVNWTAGCIAVETDREIDEIATFARTHPRALLHIIDDRPACAIAERPR